MVIEAEKLRRRAIRFFDAITAPAFRRVYLDPDFADDLVIQVLGGEVNGSGVLTLTANLADGDLIRIGTLSRGLKIYTAQTVLTDVDGHFVIGGTGSITLLNLIAAITLGAGASTLYAASTTAHPDVTAAVGASVAATETLTLTGLPLTTETVVIGGKTYTWRPEVDVDATGVLTLTGDPLDGESVLIDTKTYTFEDTLTNVDGNVLIGATASDSIDNLIAAIVLGAGSGTLYAAATTLHPTVSAAAGVGDTMDATAKSPGIGGNTIATTEGLTNGSWGAATLEDGAGGADGDVEIAGDASDSIDNLIAAIMLGAGAGTDYAAAMTLHPTVAAVIGVGDTMDATAKTVGVAGNATVTTETMDNASWGDTTMSGGVDLMNATAKQPGVPSNAIVTTETSAVASWAAGTLASGTSFTGSLAFKASLDDVVFEAVEVVDLSDGTTPIVATAPGIFRLKVSGMLVLLLDVTALSAGEMTVLGYHRGLARG